MAIGLKQAKAFGIGAVGLLLGCGLCVAALPGESQTPRSQPQPAFVVPTTVPVSSPAPRVKRKVVKPPSPASRRSKQPVRRITEPTRRPQSTATGRPGAFCATSRLGQSFTKNGNVYRCEGPKPYRWRKQ